jgi:arylsulfatase B
MDWFRNNQPVKETGYATQLWGKDAVAQINAHNPATPLFLYLAFTAPHAPYQAPQEYLDKYKHIEDPTRRAYAAMITAMDDEIGNVVAALDKKKMRDNTLIVFMSDNGGNRLAMLSGDADVSKLKLPTLMNSLARSTACRENYAGNAVSIAAPRVPPGSLT